MLIWLLLSVVHFFLSEPLVKVLFSGVHDVVVWLAFLFAGWIIIFLFMLVSFIVMWIRSGRKMHEN